MASSHPTGQSPSRRSSTASGSTDAAQRTGRMFLGASVLGALNTANARQPLSRTGRSSVLAFATGWPTSELPLHVIGWQALATLGFIRKGALRTPAGLAGLGLTAASWVGLHKIWKESLLAGDIFDEALREALGDDLDDGDRRGDPMAPRPELKLDRRRIAVPLSPWRKRYVAKDATGISYGDAGKRNTLDIWKRPDLPVDAGAPVLFQIHGGGWVIGNKEQQAMPLMSHLADRGWVCVSINYRLSPRATWPDHVVDVKRALAWVKENIGRYGGDPDFVAITGGSAGGHLCSLTALTVNEPEFQPGFEEADTSVVAAVPIYGVYDWTNRDGTGRADMGPMVGKLVFKSKIDEAREIWDKASPMSWVRPDAPPMFMLHGTNDTLVPVEQARAFVAMLRAESKNLVAYAELPGAQHAFELFDSPRSFAATAAVTRFLEAIRAREGQTVDV